MSLITNNQIPVTEEDRLKYLAQFADRYGDDNFNYLEDKDVRKLLGKVRSFERESHPQSNGSPAPETVLTSKKGRVVNFPIVNFSEDGCKLTRGEDTLSVLIYKTRSGNFTFKPIARGQGPAEVKHSRPWRLPGSVDVSDRIGEQSFAAHLASTLLRRYPINLPSEDHLIKAISGLTSGDAPWIHFLDKLWALSEITGRLHHDDVAFVKLWCSLVVEEEEDLCNALALAHFAIS